LCHRPDANYANDWGGLVDGFCATCYPHGLAPGKTSAELVEEFRGWLRAGVAASEEKATAGAKDG
jgi:hypothetical protein